MTTAQAFIRRYLSTQFKDVEYINKSNYAVVVKDRTGAQMIFTMNAYGDIIDSETKEIVAVSNCPHDIVTVGECLPTRWTNNNKY